MTSLNRQSVFRGTKFIMGKNVTVRISGTYKVLGEDNKKHTVNRGTVICENGSNEKQAFVIGVEAPLVEYTGEIIAIIKSRDTKKDTWVIAPGGYVIYEPALALLLKNFINNKYANYICLYEKSCGAVLYSDEDEERKFLLVKNMSGHIGFPKGHIELYENEIETATREVWEETGVHTEMEEGFREFYSYSVNSFVKKQAIYFVAKFKKEDIQMNIMEISEYKLVTFEQGMKILNYSHDRSILAKANRFISSKLENKIK